MEKFTYKVAFFTHEVEIGKEIISYKGKTIPGNFVTGIGFTFVKVGEVVAGQLIGGMLGAAIAQKGFGAGKELDKNLTNLPNTFGQMIITYCEDGKTQKVMRIPISVSDANCKKMLEAIVKTFDSKFVGFGGQPVVEKALKISHKVAYIIVTIIIVVVVGLIIYGSIIENGGF